MGTILGSIRYVSKPIGLEVSGLIPTLGFAEQTLNFTFLGTPRKNYIFFLKNSERNPLKPAVAGRSFKVLIKNSGK